MFTYRAASEIQAGLMQKMEAKQVRLHHRQLAAITNKL